jgi:GNAT superfamily N-acetyltransferase
LEQKYKVRKKWKIIGFYIFSNETPNDFLEMLNSSEYDFNINIVNEELFEETNRKNGIEGLALGIDESERGKGYGRKLIEYPKQMGYDYVWGIQTKGLSDIEKWTKRRDVIVNIKAPGNQEFWITVEMF